MSDEPTIGPRSLPFRGTQTRLILDAIRERGPLCSHDIATLIGHRLTSDASACCLTLVKRGFVIRAGACIHQRAPAILWAAVEPEANP